MPLLLLSLAIGALVGALAGRLLRSEIHMPRLDPVAGALGALAGAMVPLLTGPATAESLLVRLTLATLGALLATFAAHLVAQARSAASELSWVSDAVPVATPLERGAAPARAAIPFAASVASVASREQPLLVLHGGHTLRCWPSEARVPVARSTERLDWIVEVDGVTECRGPSGDARSTPLEMAVTVGRWWDDTQNARVGDDGDRS